MAEDASVTVALVLLAMVLLLIYLYIASIGKALRVAGLSEREAGLVVGMTVLLGWLTIPLFPYNGWWVGISLGGGVIPIILCLYFVWTRRAGVAESSIGIILVAYITYFITRPEEGVGIVADVPLAFAPAVAAGLYSLSVFWIDIRDAAPLAYVSGVLGSIIGADVFHLGEMLSFDAPEGGTALLSVGGGNIFDMVYLSGIVAIFVAIVVLWIRKTQAAHAYLKLPPEWGDSSEEIPYAKDFTPVPSAFPKKKTGGKTG